MRNRSPDKRCRQKLKHRIQDVNPENVQEHFQISVNVLEARGLAWANPHSINSYVVIMLGKEKHRTTIKKNMEEPYYGEYFLFEWYATFREVQRTSLWLAVMEPKCYAASRLIGEVSFDLASIWAQPNHQVFHKWARLSLAQEQETGGVGFLKVDISIVCQGADHVMPMIVNQGVVERTISAGSSSSGQQTANYLITVYGAFGLPSGSLSQGDRRYVKQPSTYVKVSFCGLSVKTAAHYQNCNPDYCEQFSIVEAFPNVCQLIRLEVCYAGYFDRVLASTDLRLGLISHDGENGFVPTFGPSLLHMYGNTSIGLGTSGENGPYYNGALLVALKTVVPYPQQGMRSTNVEPVTPIVMDDLWIWEDFLILCPIFEVSMLDKRITGKLCGVAFTVGDIPCASNGDREFILMTNEIKSRKLHYTGSRDVVNISREYGYMDFSDAFPVLQVAARLPDFRFRVFMNNMVRVIGADLKKALIAVENKLKNVEYVIPSDLVDEIFNAVDNTATSLRMFLEIGDYIDQKPGDIKWFETELDHKQLLLQKEEIEKIYYIISRRVKGNSTMDILCLASRTSWDSYTATKKEVKHLLAEANILARKIENLVFASAEGWPDIVIWLLSGNSRVAYYRMPLADAIFSVMPEQCGKHCGRIQTVYLKPLKCPKHLNSLPTSCSCIAGKIEMLLWMGLYKQKAMFNGCLPEAYILETKKNYMLSLKTTMKILQCCVFINRAKLYVGSENSSLPCSFIRVHALNSVNESQVEQNTITPTWNVVLKTQIMTNISQGRLESCPPTILVEVLDNDISGKIKIIGHVEIQPVIDNIPSYENAPKLQWYDIQEGVEITGMILMSAQFLQTFPDLYHKSYKHVTTASWDCWKYPKKFFPDISETN